MYAFACFTLGLLNHLPNATISTAFIVGVCSITVLSVVRFIHQRTFQIILFFFLVAAIFYLEFDPYRITVYTFAFNSVTLFVGKVIPLAFLIVYVYHFRKPVVHFIRTTKLWND